VNAHVQVLTDEFGRIMQHQARHMEAVMFGVDRSAMGTIPIRAMRIYQRELRKMTVEEIESALVGFNAAFWEALPDEPARVVADPNVSEGAMFGLTSWLP
jgi:hypothetical protein